MQMIELQKGMVFSFHKFYNQYSGSLNHTMSAKTPFVCSYTGRIVDPMQPSRWSDIHHWCKLEAWSIQKNNCYPMNAMNWNRPRFNGENVNQCILHIYQNNFRYICIAMHVFVGTVFNGLFKAIKGYALLECSLILPSPVPVWSVSRAHFLVM